jgi:hypothetical protein
MEQIAEMLDPSQISVLFETMNVSGVKNQKENPKNPPKKKTQKIPQKRKPKILESRRFKDRVKRIVIPVKTLFFTSPEFRTNQSASIFTLVQCLIKKIQYKLKGLSNSGFNPQ